MRSYVIDQNLKWINSRWVEDDGSWVIGSQPWRWVGKKQILAGHHQFWLGNNHCHSELGKNVILSQGWGGNPAWSCNSRSMLWCFTTKLETQWRAQRQKMILYKVRLKESTVILDMRVYSENRKFPTMNSGFPWRHCRVYTVSIISRRYGCRQKIRSFFRTVGIW